MGILGVDELSGDAPLMEAGLDSLRLGRVLCEVLEDAKERWRFLEISQDLSEKKHKNS